MFLNLLIISIVLVGISMAGLGVRMLLQPHGRFPETHISKNKNMRDRGISCATSTDTGCKPCNSKGGCSGCGLD